MRSTFARSLNGLREVHSNKLLHLDIKPGNVYVRNDGSPLLIDFGAARQQFSAEGLKLPPSYTPGFAAPEQHGGRRSGPGPTSTRWGRRFTPALPLPSLSRRTRG